MTPSNEPTDAIHPVADDPIADRAALADDLAALAEEAGQAIAEIYAAPDIAVDLKDDASPVTAADHRAEEVILAGLSKLTPTIPAVAEERVAAGEIPDDLGVRFWLVDPLDGTKEFLSRNGEFTVNVALVEAGEPTLGVVHLPALEVTYTGVDGRAHVRDRAGTRPIRVRTPGAEGFAVLVSRSHLDEETESWLSDVRVAERVSAGSSLKFCRIADGTADLYPRFGRTMEWDTAAGDAVLRAAGGNVRETTGKSLRYGKEGFANPPFIAYGGRPPKA